MKSSSNSKIIDVMPYKWVKLVKNRHNNLLIGIKLKYKGHKSHAR